MRRGPSRPEGLRPPQRAAPAGVFSLDVGSLRSPTDDAGRPPQAPDHEVLGSPSSFLICSLMQKAGPKTRCSVTIL